MTKERQSGQIESELSRQATSRQACRQRSRQAAACDRSELLIDKITMIIYKKMDTTSPQRKCRPAGNTFLPERRAFI